MLNKNWQLENEGHHKKIPQELLKPPFDIVSFLRNKLFQNACLESECERILCGELQYYYVALLYHSKNKIQKTLQSLYNIGTGSWIDSAGHTAKDAKIFIFITNVFVRNNTK